MAIREVGLSVKDLKGEDRIIEAAERFNASFSGLTPPTVAEMIQKLYKGLGEEGLKRYSNSDFYRGLVEAINSGLYLPENILTESLPKTGTLKYAGFELDIDHNRLLTPEGYQTRLGKNNKGGDQLTFMAGLMVARGSLIPYSVIQTEILNLPEEFGEECRSLIVDRAQRLRKTIQDPVLEKPVRGKIKSTAHVRIVRGSGLMLV